MKLNTFLIILFFTFCVYQTHSFPLNHTKQAIAEVWGTGGGDMFIGADPKTGAQIMQVKPPLQNNTSNATVFPRLEIYPQIDINSYTNNTK